MTLVLWHYGVVIKNVNSGAKVLRSNPGSDTYYVVTLGKSFN